MTEWSKYGACPFCREHKGKPCRDGNGVLATPHTGRALAVRFVLVVLDPVPLSDLPDVVQEAEIMFSRPADKLMLDTTLAAKLGVVLAIVPK